MRLDKLLTENTKARRRKLNAVNFMVTFITWLIEFVGSFILIFIPKIVGHGQVGTGAGWIFCVSLYFVLLPFAYLINSTDIKQTIVDESWFHAVRGIFSRTSIQVLRKNN